MKKSNELSKNDEIRECSEHGRINFRYRKSKKGEWWVCELCLKSQWRKARDRHVKKPGVQQYNRDYANHMYQIRKSLSLYLTMILLASNVTPE